jgi:hypothetical protein
MKELTPIQQVYEQFKSDMNNKEFMLWLQDNKERLLKEEEEMVNTAYDKGNESDQWSNGEYFNQTYKQL